MYSLLLIHCVVDIVLWPNRIQKSFFFEQLYCPHWHGNEPTTYKPYDNKQLLVQAYIVAEIVILTAKDLCFCKLVPMRVHYMLVCTAYC